MLYIPLQVMLGWPVPNWQNAKTRTNLELYWASSIFLGLATICVLSRLFSRLFIRRYLGIDDVFIFVAFLCTIGVMFIVSIGYHKLGWNRHIWDLRPDMYSPALKFFYWARILWGQAAAFARFSVTCLYYRLLGAADASPSYYWVLHANTIFNIGLQLFYLFTGIFPCWPIKAYWSYPSDPFARCINDSASMQAAGVLNTVAEFIMALLPLIAVFRLRVERGKRWSVLGLLSLGFLVSFVGIWRTFFIWKALTTYDLTWWLGPQWIASEVENSMALICACAVPIRPLAGRLAQRFHRLPSPAPSDSAVASEGRSGNFASKHQLNFDAHHPSHWTSTGSRAIDLEGIADDGFGYTVTITSLHQTQQTVSRQVWRVPSFKIRKNTIKDLGETNEGLIIPTLTEVVVEECGKRPVTKQNESNVPT